MFGYGFSARFFMGWACPGRCNVNERSLSTDEQEALVQVIIHKIPSIKEADRLKELVHQALELMLHNPEDSDLRKTLNQCANDIFVGMEFVPPSDARKARVRRSARDCVEVLLAAKEHRLPRDILYPPGVQGVPGTAANDNHHPDAHAKTAPKRVSARARNNRVLAGVFAAVLGMAAIGGAGIWQGMHTDRSSAFSEAKSFTEQVFSVAGGAEDMPNRFGGHVTRHVKEGRVNVVADKVPARVCAAAGWELVHKGTLTVDGVTPRRVSSAIITELCYGGEGAVTINWEPKPRF